MEQFIRTNSVKSFRTIADNIKKLRAKQVKAVLNHLHGRVENLKHNYIGFRN